MKSGGKKIKENICPVCNGVGYTAEHDLPSRHGEDGECINCPIQVQCDHEAIREQIRQEFKEALYGTDLTKLNKLLK